MSLAAMLAAHDDAALEALASKGLVRRARRDVGAGLARIVERDGGMAIVEADGERVIVEAKGVAAASCGCPASGVCRHVLVAVMALRSSAPDDTAPPATPGATSTAASSDTAETTDTPAAASAPEVPAAKGAARRTRKTGSSAPVSGTTREKPRTAPALSAREELVALSAERLRKFAGADWTDAAALALADGRSTVTDEGASCRVAIDGGLATITFIAGQGLRGAVCKGSATKARLLKSAAALLVRRQAGVVDAVDAPDTETSGLAPGFIDTARATLTEAASLTLSSASPLAADLLFDLAISARAEAAPRVTGALRGLARQAMLAPSRHVDFDAEAFLRDAARTAALLEAIRHAPNDTDLVGTLRRDYTDAPPLELLMLGARIWTSDGGARGVTAYGYSTDDGRWYSATHARGAGMDPGFSPRDAWRTPLWGTGSMADMTGRRVRLPEPRVDASGAIAGTVPEPGVILPREALLPALHDDAVTHTDWRALFADVASRLGSGLHRGARPVPALVAPAGFGSFGFDDFRQRYDWEARDGDGRVLRLALAGDAHALALALRAIAPRIRLMLLEVAFEARELTFRPVSVVFDDKGALDVRVIDTDGLPAPGRLERMRSAVGELFTPRRTLASVRVTGIDKLLDRVTSAAVDLASHAPKPDLAALANDADTLALSTLASAVRQANADPCTSSAIRLAYLASELRDAGRFAA